MRWKSLLLLVFATGFCLGVEDEDLSASKLSVEKSLEDYVRKQACSLPEDMDGQWETTLWGNITVSGFVLQTDLNLGGSEVSDLECYLKSDLGETVLRGTKTIYQDGEEFEILTCIEIIPRNADNYHIIVKTDRDARLENEPLKLRPLNASSSGDTDFLSCEKNSDKWVHGNMVRKGRVKSAAVPCPPALVGSFSMSFLGRAGSARCPEGAALLSSPEPSSSLVIDYTHCKQHDKPGEEGNEKETFWCVAKTGAGTTVYQEGQKEGSFSCVSVKPDPVHHIDRMIYTQRQGACGDTAWSRRAEVPAEMRLMIAFLSHTKKQEKSSNEHQSPPNRLMQKDSAILEHINHSKSHVIISKLNHKSSGAKDKTDATKKNDQKKGGNETNTEAENVTPKVSSSMTKGSAIGTTESAKDGALHLVPHGAVFTLCFLLVAINLLN